MLQTESNTEVTIQFDSIRNYEYSHSIIGDSAKEQAAAVNKAAVNKAMGCAIEINVIETASAWNHLAIELVQQIGQRITAVTQEPTESMFLFLYHLWRLDSCPPNEKVVPAPRPVVDFPPIQDTRVVTRQKNDRQSRASIAIYQWRQMHHGQFGGDRLKG